MSHLTGNDIRNVTWLLIITLCCDNHGKLDHMTQGPYFEQECRIKAQKMNEEWRKIHAQIIAHCEAGPQK